MTPSADFMMSSGVFGYNPLEKKHPGYYKCTENEIFRK